MAHARYPPTRPGVGSDTRRFSPSPPLDYASLKGPALPQGQMPLKKGHEQEYAQGSASVVTRRISLQESRDYVKIAKMASLAGSSPGRGSPIDQQGVFSSHRNLSPTLTKAQSALLFRPATAREHHRPQEPRGALTRHRSAPPGSHSVWKARSAVYKASPRTSSGGDHTPRLKGVAIRDTQSPILGLKERHKARGEPFWAQAQAREPKPKPEPKEAKPKPEPQELSPLPSSSPLPPPGPGSVVDAVDFSPVPFLPKLDAETMTDLVDAPDPVPDGPKEGTGPVGPDVREPGPAARMDLETLWGQLQAERAQRHKLQHRLQVTEEKLAESAGAQSDADALRLQLQVEKLQSRRLQLQPPVTSKRTMMYDAAVQTGGNPSGQPSCDAATQTAAGAYLPPTGMEEVQRQVALLEQALAQRDETIEQLDALIKEGDAVRRKLHVTNHELTRTIKERNSRIDELERALQQGDLRYRDRIAALTADLRETCDDLQQMDVRMREMEAERRRLHYQVQELRGNIRVICRVRPQLEGEPGTAAAFEFPDSGLDNRTLALVSEHERAPKKYLFSFDRVFGGQATQAEVFEQVSPLVQSALDGFKVCLFAYGQTGSGKTFTMQGPPDFRPGGPEAGVIPLAMKMILQCALQRTGGWQYTLQATCSEVYNNELRDLLAPQGDEAFRLQVVHDAGGGTSVTNLTSVEVQDEAVLMELLKVAARNRAIAATRFNQHSSRSHSVFTLSITGTSPCRQRATHGTLNIVDLAGSERLDASPTDPERLKEVQHINRSLSCLGDVIAALSQKSAQHVPYRNSRLTYLLQNSLTHGAKILMFVNVSPLAEHINESVCSLRFASKVNSCEVGVARRLVEERDTGGWSHTHTHR
uniref:Kinesin-like protein n=1 Tax=Eutreptiella gymnastica TaxID=73025 RepID=A0A7S1IEH7_9EUGL|mmetsp:Transcript_151307/g.264346  ORF Transcript_151307/g.264346 Transcript_151307/m.264346 type:complete len:872 (+) Transcript_151307:113-2728(+)